MAVPADRLMALYRSMVRIRRFEERATALFKSGAIKGTAHSYAGQEAIAAGACLALEARDYVGSYHRGHGHCIAKGASIRQMMAELMGKVDGSCRGLGGSMHIADLELNILGANGIVGATMPLGIGAALAATLKSTGAVAVAFFGDGAANQGVFHESLNLASVWRLPVIFVCENNQYALNTAYHQTTATETIAERAAAYSMPGTRVDGNDVVEVLLVVEEAVERARAGEGPSLIEAMTWRWGPHSMRANLIEPRTPAEMNHWLALDPLEKAKRRLLDENVADLAATSAIDSEAEAEIDAAVAYAEQSLELSFAEALDCVWAPAILYREPGPEAAAGRTVNYAEALNEALRQEMQRDADVIVMGEDVGLTGGIFQVTKDLLEYFGPERVRDTPISEATFCGAGVGAAIAGLRPVVEVQIFDFVTLMMDMIVNQAAKFRFMNGGRPTVPLVIRGPQGGGIRLAAQHSQSLESWFVHVPGLKVVAPATPYDAKGLLAGAIRDDNPVIFLEHKLLYLEGTGPVPAHPYAIPLGKGVVRRPGRDVTVIATLAMVSRALQAAALLERDGISVEVIDPRTLRPLDEDLILGSVRRTNRTIIVHEGWRFGGFGAEVAALITEQAFDWLDAPPLRLGAADMPMPFNARLEAAVIPSRDSIIAAVRSLV